jgi:hemerythrin
MGIKWDDSLCTGIEEVDCQHRALFDKINSFLDGCDEGKGTDELVPLLQFLDDYARVHFAREEELQEQEGYWRLPSHRIEHRKFMEMLMELKMRFLREGASPGLVAEVNEVVVEWLMEHIGGKDREFGLYMKEKEEPL